jgi:hypothetical protein
MARKSHTAKGSVGEHAAPARGQTTGRCSSAQRSRSKCGSALIQKTASTASAPSVTTTDTRNESSTPSRFKQRKSA